MRIGVDSPLELSLRVELDINNLRVGSSVSHGQQTGLVVLQLEVLIGELLAVDGLAASALQDD